MSFKKKGTGNHRGLFPISRIVDHMTKLFAFLLIAFSIGTVFGKPPKYPNQLKGFKLIDHVKLRSFVVGVTPQEVVEARFGTNCEVGFCYLDENWSVKFYYFSKGERKSPRDPKFPRSVPIIKYDGRLRAIVLKPLAVISLKPNRFGKQLSREEGFLVDDEGKNNLWNYQDRYGLKYVTLARASHLGRKYDLLEIEYGLPPADEARAFEEW